MLPPLASMLKRAALVLSLLCLLHAQLGAAFTCDAACEQQLVDNTTELEDRVASSLLVTLANITTPTYVLQPNQAEKMIREVTKVHEMLQFASTGHFLPRSTAPSTSNLLIQAQTVQDTLLFRACKIVLDIPPPESSRSGINYVAITGRSLRVRSALRLNVDIASPSANPSLQQVAETNAKTAHMLSNLSSAEIPDPAGVFSSASYYNAINGMWVHSLYAVEDFFGLPHDSSCQDGLVYSLCNYTAAAEACYDYFPQLNSTGVAPSVNATPGFSCDSQCRQQLEANATSLEDRIAYPVLKTVANVGSNDELPLDIIQFPSSGAVDSNNGTYDEALLTQALNLRSTMLLRACRIVQDATPRNEDQVEQQLTAIRSALRLNAEVSLPADISLAHVAQALTDAEELVQRLSGALQLADSQDIPSYLFKAWADVVWNTAVAALSDVLAIPVDEVNQACASYFPSPSPAPSQPGDCPADDQSVCFSTTVCAPSQDSAQLCFNLTELLS